MIVQADAKSLEWITYLFLSQDKEGIREWFNFVADPKLNDIHQRNQDDFRLPERRVAKFFLFRCIYRGPAYAYANDPDFMHVSKSERFWQKVIDRFFEKYNGLNRKHIEYIQSATTTGRIVTPIGRVHEFTPKQTGRGLKWNESDICNWPNQGCGADVMQVARVMFGRRFLRAGFTGKICSTVHDSLVADVPDNEVLAVTKLMHSVFEELPKAISQSYQIDWNLPLLCEVQAGPNMLDMEEVVVV